MGANASEKIKSRSADQKIFQIRKKVKDTEYPVGASSLTFFLIWIEFFLSTGTAFYCSGSRGGNPCKTAIYTKGIYDCVSCYSQKSQNLKSQKSQNSKTILNALFSVSEKNLGYRVSWTSENLIQGIFDYLLNEKIQNFKNREMPTDVRNECSCLIF